MPSKIASQLRPLLFAAAIAVRASAAFAAEELSIESLCRTCPQRIERLFAGLDLDRTGLETVRSAVQSKDWPAACKELIAYYRKGKTAAWLRRDPPKPAAETRPEADAILKDTITCNRIAAKVPRLPTGRLNWAYNGPDGDREWGWGLNRHFHIRTLCNTYFATGNPAYLRCLDRHLTDWVLSNPYPAKRSSTPPWRGLEAFFRVVTWADVFFGLQQCDGFTPAARVLVLTSIPEHAHYLRHFHAGGGNWITMEMHGLATAAACWPEFKDADPWFDYAFGRILPQITEQVYPDGVQKELTSHYHWVALHNFEDFARLARRAGRSLPPAFDAGLERMWNYLAYAMRPDGYGPLNNDSDRDYNRSRVLERADSRHRNDWAYIATNGKQGKKPAGPPSVVFPWAGQLIMRSGWDADAHWAFFDVGPLGIGHQHYDKLHLSVAAYGRDLLVDGGRFTYKGGSFRNHFVGSASHNVILIDGKGHHGKNKAVSRPMEGNCAIEDRYDYARGTFDESFGALKGKAAHTRAVVYLRGRYWIVVDRITTDRPRTIQPLWHFHPDCTVAVDGTSVASTDPAKGNLRIVPVADFPWNVRIIKGQTEPTIQGWWSRRYNHKQPAPTAVYSANIDKSATFAWVLVPARGTVPRVAAKTLSATQDAMQLEIQLPGAKSDRITIPLTGKPSDSF